MHETNGEHYDLIRRTNPGRNAEAEAKRAAYLRTTSLLSSWRLNFTGDEYLNKSYPNMSLEGARADITLESASDTHVHAEAAFERHTAVYDFNTETQEISAEYHTSGDTELPEPPDYLVAHDELARILFDCDRYETRGRSPEDIA